MKVGDNVNTINGKDTITAIYSNGDIELKRGQFSAHYSYKVILKYIVTPIKNIFNHLFIPIDTEIKYTEGAKFKITITTDAKLRIKIPRNTDNNVERIFILKCKKITKYFQLRPYHATLRGIATTPTMNSGITLKANNRVKIFNVIGTTVKEIQDVKES